MTVPSDTMVLKIVGQAPPFMAVKVPEAASTFSTFGSAVAGLMTRTAMPPTGSVLAPDILRDEWVAGCRERQARGRGRGR